MVARTQDLVPKGEMNLYGAAVIFVGPPKVSRYNCLEVSGPTRTLFISADTQQEAKEWAIAIQKAAIAQTGGQSVANQLLLTGPKKKVDIDKHLAHMSANTTGTEVPAFGCCFSSIGVFMFVAVACK